jgi:GDPmannose 4,6-dehydratase
VKGVVDIQNAKTNYISVGNLDAKRDWGHAKDYVEGMYLMVQQPKPDDYVLATGKLHSIRQMIEKCFEYFDNKITWDGDGLDEVGVDKYGDVVIRVDPKYYRPAEVDLLCGDATKAKDVLGWEPKYTFDDMLEEMLDSALKFSD